MEKILEVKNIEKYYGNKSNLTKAIDNINFDVNKGEFVGIMGASGSGKTTLLNCISTIDRVTAGHIIINGEDITKLKGNNLNKFRREELGFIFQDFNLLDTLTAYENIALALTICKINYGEINKRITNIADKLNMMNIPYCYEVPLYLKGYGYVKPDFKVLNVATRKEYYWEHYGMMDNKDYIIKALKKKNSYISNNFIVGDNLIETYESQSCPLDTRNVEKIIKTFLV